MEQIKFAKLLENVKSLVTEILIPLEHKVAETDCIPREVIKEFIRYNLFGLTIPEQYGGLGATIPQEVVIIEELGKASPAFCSFIGTNHGIGSQSLIIKGTEEQKNKYLPKLASGEMISAFCLTEKNAGSDALGIETTATSVEGGWLINGSKRYITNAPEAALFTVAAKIKDNSMIDNKSLSLFLVEANNEGLSIGKNDIKMGHKGSHTAEVFFRDCFVPISAMIGSSGSGMKTIMQVLDRGRLHIAALSVGIAERLINDSLEYALNRKQFNTPIADFQIIKSMIAEMTAIKYAAFCMVKETADRLEQDHGAGYEASSCKLLCSEMAGKVADMAVQIHGGTGYIHGNSTERFYRDVRLLRIYEGTNELQKLIISRAAMKIYKKK